MSNHFQYPFNPINWPGVPHDFTGDNNLGIYTSETTQRYVYGTRYITWDGRVYKYMGLTTNGSTSRTGVCTTAGNETDYVTAVGAPAGSRAFTVTDTGTFSEDQLAGGSVFIYDSTTANSTNHFIVGNDSSAGTNIRVFLEFPLPHTVTTSDSVEMWPNPYRLVQSGDSQETSAWLGIATQTAASGYKVWVQTWGTALISPGNTTLDDAAANERQVFWYGNGTLGEYGGTNITIGKQQLAGYLQDTGTGDIAGPRIYLMCST